MSPEQAPNPGTVDIEVLYAAIQRRGTAIPGELMKEFGLARSTLTHYLRQLAKANRIERIGSGRGAKYQVAQITPPPSNICSTNPSPATPPIPEVNPAKEGHPKPKEGGESSSSLGEDLKQVWLGFVAAGVKDMFGKLPKNRWAALGQLIWKSIATLTKHFFKSLWKLIVKAFHGVIRIVGEILGKVLVTILSLLLVILLIWGLITAFLHPKDFLYVLKSQFMGAYQRISAQMTPPKTEEAQPTPVPASPVKTLFEKATSILKKVTRSKPATASHPKVAARSAVLPSQIVLPKTTPPPDGAFARAFCGALYNMKYQDPYANADAVAAMVGPEYGQDIVDTYYSDERMKTCEDEKQTWSFKADGDPAMTAKKGDDSDYLVKGTITITEEGNSHIDTRPFSLLVTINHNANGFPQVLNIVEQKGDEK